MHAHPRTSCGEGTAIQPVTLANLRVAFHRCARDGSHATTRSTQWDGQTNVGRNPSVFPRQGRWGDVRFAGIHGISGSSQPCLVRHGVATPSLVALEEQGRCVCARCEMLAWDSTKQKRHPACSLCGTPRIGSNRAAHAGAWRLGPRNAIVASLQVDLLMLFQTCSFFLYRSPVHVRKSLTLRIRRAHIFS